LDDSIITRLKENVIEGRFLVDGGLVNPVPVSAVREMGADLIIAVDVTPDKSERANSLIKKDSVKEPGIFQVIVQSIYISSYYTSRVVSEGADVVIHPLLAHIGPGEFHRASECILEGELAAVDSIAEIKRHLAQAGIPLNKPQISR